MRRTLILITTVALLGGCAPSIPVHYLATGMTRSEVISQLGKPTDVAGTGNVEYLWYNPANRFWQRYYVRLIDGKVESYGPVESEPTPAAK
jgi:hypothetical protein